MVSWYNIIMPQLTLKLSWEQYEALKILSEADQILLEEIALRAIDNYVLTRQVETAEKSLPGVTDLEDHLLGSDEVMNLGI
jgi:hypothetical protein